MRPTTPIRLAIADDHPIVLDGLEHLFRLEPDVEVVARCQDGEATLRAVRATAPDVLVLDLRMPGLGGLEVLRAMAEEGAGTKVVLLTAAVDDEQLVEALHLGARGVVLKEMAPQMLVEAVREVHAGRSWLEQGVSNRALRRLLDRERSALGAGSRLTPRELEIVQAVAQGLRNRAIAEKLCISEGTVKIHLHNVFEKLGVESRLELVLLAKEKSLV